MGLKLDTLDICPPPVRIGVELNSKKFSQRSLYSPLTVKKKVGISIPSPPQVQPI